MRICPMIRERVAWLKENGYPHFRLIQLVGGRRSGKGLMTSICIARKVWEVVQSDDPSVRWGIDQDKDIYIPIVAAKQQQAKDHQYGDAQGAISSCGALKKYVKGVREEKISIYTPSDLRKEAEMRSQGVDYKRDLAKIRVIPVATSADTVRGAAAISIVFDEMAHGMTGDSRRAVDEVWRAAIPSLAQFGKSGQIFANSSPYTKTGIFYELYEASQEIENGFPKYPDHLMIQMPSWEMYMDWDTHSDKPGPMVTYEMVKQEEQIDPDKFKVEYRAQFAETENAFLDPERVDAMFQGSFAGRTLDTCYAGVALYEYRGHADPSSTTANFGFVVAHMEYQEETEMNPITGEVEHREMVPHVVFDLIDAFYPADMENNVIDYELAVNSIVQYIRLFRPRSFSFDQFSIGPLLSQVRKRVHEMNIYDCRIYERTATGPSNRKMWDTFKAALYLGRLHAPNPKGQMNERSLALAREEAKFLIDRNGKVMKQDIGPVQTSDIIVSCANIVETLIGDDISGRSKAFGSSLQTGSPHGYKIGGDPFGDYYAEAQALKRRGGGGVGGLRAPKSRQRGR